MLSGVWLSKPFNSAKELNKIKQNLQDLKNEHSPTHMQNIQQILNFFLGNPDQQGILFSFANSFSQYEPMEWILEMEYLLQHIGPLSPTFNQLLKRNDDPNSQITIASAYLPSYFDPNANHKSILSMRIVRLGVSMPPVDAFFIMLASAIYHSDPVMPPLTHYNNLIEDSFFSSLSRNPLLVLLRKYLQHFSFQNKPITQKITQSIRIFLMDQVLIKHEQDRLKYGQQKLSINQSFDFSVMMATTKTVQLKYRLKLQHLHAVYLLLRYGLEFISSDFAKYVQGVLEYYGVLRPDSMSLEAVVRVWNYAMTAKSEKNIENEVIRVLDQANSKSGWFHLKRYSPHLINSNSTMGQYNIQTALTILKLFEKQSYWVPNASYLFTLACFFRLLGSSKIFFSEFSNAIKTNSTKHENIMEKVMRTVVNRFNKNLVDILSSIKKTNANEYPEAYKLVQTHISIIEQYLREYLKSKEMIRTWSGSPNNGLQTFELPPEFKFKEVKECQLNLTTQNLEMRVQTNDAIEHNPQTKRNLVSFYRSQPRGCWEVPIQYNESTILYYVLLSIAKILDLVIPGKKNTSPRINIRFLANPINFLGLLILVLLLAYLYK